ncbi:hypothetical protein V1508DRAFT_460729 [Lipomyces doorenjongii]|uniref:uncharacterized protein n=1 Tax=Lipomyces doorenjongii TaxID=383834 RepID=UPI0034CEB04B
MGNSLVPGSGNLSSLLLDRQKPIIGPHATPAMADHRHPASFRSTPVSPKIDTGFTLHLPPTTRPLVGDLVESADCPSWHAQVQDDNQQQLTGEKPCPDCGQLTLRKCLIHENFAIILCVDKACGYPFAEDDIRIHIVPVTSRQILEAARRRMLDAGVGEDTAKKIVQSRKLDVDSIET